MNLHVFVRFPARLDKVTMEQNRGGGGGGCEIMSIITRGSMFFFLFTLSTLCQSTLLVEETSSLKQSCKHPHLKVADPFCRPPQIHQTLYET